MKCQGKQCSNSAQCLAWGVHFYPEYVCIDCYAKLYRAYGPLVYREPFEEAIKRLGGNQWLGVTHAISRSSLRSLANRVRNLLTRKMK